VTYTLHLGDCLTYMQGMAAGSVDAVITDPPYGIAHPCNYHERGRGKLAACNDYPDVIGDAGPFDPSPFLSYPKVVLWGGNHFADRLPPSGGWLVWDKERPDDLDQSTCELAWTNCVKGVRRYRYLWNGMMRAGEHGENYHATQKPVALMRWVLSLPWLQGAATIFDPFMGSGTTGVACMQLGRNFIGCEIDPTYFAIAEKRIAAAASQMRLEGM
jgi:site-specific DNA-methyltransferase (adenine-specific)